jgi:hypothetical protein
VVTLKGEFQADHIGTKPKGDKKQTSPTISRYCGTFFYVLVLLERQKKGHEKTQPQYPNRTPYPKKRLGGTIVGKWLTFDGICLYSIYLIIKD